MKLHIVILLVFCLVLFLNQAYATATLVSVGMGKAPHWTSEEITSTQTPYLNMNNGYLLRVDVEQHIWLKLSLFFGFDYFHQSGLGVYDYTNRTESVTLTQADIRMIGTQVISRGGLRTYFGFLYLGAGGLLGRLGLVWDEDQFRATNGNALGFKREDQRSFKGYFGEAGVRFVFKKWGIRVGYARMFANTGPFETLHDTKINLDETQFTASFIIII